MTDIYSDHQRRVFCLVIAGVPVRYHSGPSPAAHLGGQISAVAAVPYTDVNSLVSVSQYSSRLDVIGGVATYDPITITLAVDRFGGETDPSTIFGRLGRRAASVTSAQLRASILHRDLPPFDIEVEGSGNFPGNPTVVHIGAETFTKTSSVSHGTWEEVRIIERGVGGSTKQNHVINEVGLIPEATNHVTNWRSRRATLYAATLRDDGTTTPYTEIMRGFIDTSPRADSDTSIALDLVPITAMLDNEIASEQGYSTTLRQGWHYFESDKGCVIEHAQGTLESELGTTFPTVSGQITAFNAATGEITLSGGHNHQQIFDITLEDRHPRSGRFIGFRDFNVAEEPSAYSPAVPPHTGYFFPVGLWAPSVGQDIILLNPLELQRYEILPLGSAAELREWPDLLNDFNAAQPVTHAGIGGAWLRLTFADIHTAEPKLNAAWNTAAPVVGGRFGVGFWTDKFLAHQTLQDGAALPAMLWDPVGGPWPMMTNDRRLNYAIDYAPAGDDHFVVDWQNDADGGSQRVYRHHMPSPATMRQTIRGIARGFYQLGERYVLVSDPLILPAIVDPSTVYYLQITYFDRAEQATKSRMMEAFTSAAVSSGGQVIGYAIRVNPFTLPPSQRVGSFGDWPGSPRCEIKLGSYLDGLTPGGLILRLLLSGGGGQINDPTYDVLSYGAGLTTADLDVTSIEAITAPLGLDLWRLALPGDGISVREVIDPILKALGYALVMRRLADGRCVLGAVAIGAEYSDTSAGTIAEGDWLTDDPPIWGAADTIVNSLEILADYDSEAEEYRSETTINNQRSIGALSGEVRPLELTLPGLELNRVDWEDAASTLAIFRPLFSRIFNLYGAPVRTFSGGVGTGRGLRGEVGSVYSLTSSHLRGYDDSWGVEDVRALVTSSTVDLMGEGTHLELMYYGTLGAGWNAAALVTVIDSPTSVIVSATTFSDVSPTGDPLKDIQGFGPGAQVDHLPAGDHDGRTSHTINSVDIAANRIVFNAAHGLATAGGTIEPPTYDNATSARQLQAYLADAAGKLGAANDDGKNYL